MKIKENDPKNKWRKAIEFRNPTWYVSETFELLDEYGAAIVLHDIPKAKIFNSKQAAKFIYLRFHGPSGDYRGSYSNDFLREQWGKIQEWLKNDKDVYVYFNNTMGAAFENAMTLKAMAER